MGCGAGCAHYGTEKMHIEKGYEVVAEVLQKALDQAQSGKGKERHGHGLPFTEQKILAISRGLRTDGGLAYQIEKKVQEGREFDNIEQLERELLGAIIYTVAMIVYHREKFAAASVEKYTHTDMTDSDNWEDGDTVFYKLKDTDLYSNGHEYTVCRSKPSNLLQITNNFSGKVNNKESCYVFTREAAEHRFTWVKSK